MYDNYKTYVASRIESHSIKRDNGCIEYAGGGLKHKYGLVSLTLNGKRKSVPASRAYYMAYYNRFDLGPMDYVCHTCDNPCCVNIAHLFLGTPKVNTEDMLSKGRKAIHYKLHTRKLVYTDDQILDMKHGKEKPGYYVWKYGVSLGYLSKLRNNKAKTLVA